MCHRLSLKKNIANKLRKNSKKKSSYASNKIEGNPLSEKQVDEVIESDASSNEADVEVSKELNVTNKTVINRLAVLSRNGFVVPIMVKQRIRSYELSDFTKDHEKEIVRKAER